MVNTTSNLCSPSVCHPNGQFAAPQTSIDTSIQLKSTVEWNDPISLWHLVGADVLFWKRLINTYINNIPCNKMGVDVRPAYHWRIIKHCWNANFFLLPFHFDYSVQVSLIMQKACTVPKLLYNHQYKEEMSVKVRNITAICLQIMVWQAAYHMNWLLLPYFSCELMSIHLFIK